MIAPHIGGKIRLFSRYARGLPSENKRPDPAKLSRMQETASYLEYGSERRTLWAPRPLFDRHGECQLAAFGNRVFSRNPGFKCRLAKKSDWRRALTLRRGGQQGASCIAKQEQKGVDLL